MDSVPLSMYIILTVLIFLSAFFSSSEIAYSSLNKIRLRNYVDEKRKGAIKAYYIAENFDEALSTIVIGNNIVNVAAATIAANISYTLVGGNTALFISTFITTLLVLIFGEILPKSFAKENAEIVAMKFSGVLFILIKFLSPINWLFLKLKNGVGKISSKGNSKPSVTEEELKVMVDISEEEGVIDDRERNLVKSALEFDEITVDSILTPRTDIVAINVSQNIEEITEIFFENKYSRIPVYEDRIDNIIGILSEREFFSAVIRSKGNDFDIRPLLQKPIFISGSMKISSLLPELQLKKTHMTIVIDEFGGTKGLITLEDLLEELVGDIWDEHDEEILGMIKLNNNTYEFNGDYAIDEFCQFFNVSGPEINSHSLGGWIMEVFERVPEKGESFTYETLSIVANKVEGRRIKSLKVIQNQEDESTSIS